MSVGCEEEENELAVADDERGPAAGEAPALAARPDSVICLAAASGPNTSYAPFPRR